MGSMWLEIVLIIVSIAVVLWGADRFTDGASGLARHLKISELVIGLTVVALGTSLPEFMVSFMSVLRGSSDMSVGNIIGSNVFNILGRSRWRVPFSVATFLFALQRQSCWLSLPSARA